jgi:hypothetical protein
VYPEIAEDLFQTAGQLRWRHADVLMDRGVTSKTADGLLGAQKWLDDHPSVKALLNNTGRMVGVGVWIKNFTPVGLLVGVVMEVGYTRIMKLIEEKTNSQENLSAFLLSIDDDLNQEQANVLASSAIQFMEGAGRMAMHGFSAKKVKQWEKSTKGLEMKDSKGLKGGTAKTESNVIDQASQGILKDGYYEVNGFKFSEYYYNKLWSTGRGAPSLIAKEVFEGGAKSAVPYTFKIGFNKYTYGGWEMIYNPVTKEVWHLQPIK